MQTQLQHAQLFPDGSNPSDIAFQQGFMAYEAGDMNAALDAFTQAINISTHYHQHYHYQSSYQHLCLGDAYSAADNWQLAILHYGKAIFQEHNNQLAFKGRSHAYRQLGEYEKAAADKAKVINPEIAEYPYRYADDATFRTAIGAPDNYSCQSDAHMRLGKANRNDTINQFKTAIELSTKAHDYYHTAASSQIYCRAITYLAMGENDLAKNDLIKALDLNRKNTSAIELQSALAEMRKAGIIKPL